MKKKIFEILNDMGISMKLQGREYMEKAILMVAENKDMRGNICSKLYPTIAKEFGVNAGSVERCIRYAIEYSMQNDGFKKYFYERPTNAEFIYTMARFVEEV